MQSPINQTSTFPSNELASEIISLLLNKRQSKYSLYQLLQILKQKKNLNYEKFSNYIQKEVFESKTELFKVIDAIKYLSRKSQQVRNTNPQVKSIVNGLKKYFYKIFQKQIITSKIKKQIAIKLIKEYVQFSVPFCHLISQLIAQMIHKLPQQQKQVFRRQSFQIVIQIIKGRNLQKQDSQKCCILVQHMNLYERFRTEDLVHICKNADFDQILAFFKEKEGGIRKQLADAYIIKQTSKNEKKVQKFITKLKLKHQDYPQLVKNANRKCLRYLLNNQPIYAIDLKVKGRPEVVQCLIQILLEQRRIKEAIHFTNKNYISKYYHLNQGNNRSYNKNLLQKFDQFLPTQMILFKCFPNEKKYSENCLTMQQLNYQQQSVIFVNRQNFHKQFLDNIMYSPQFGIDTESAPVYSAYEKKVMQIMQIALNYKKIDKKTTKQKIIKFVYIIDIIDLMGFQMFRSWFQQICNSYKGKIIGHTVKTDFQGIINEIGINIDQSLLQNLQFIDIGERFKQINQQTKSSLQYICNSVLKRKLSKFQQCSGWQNRPLRKAQLHYAALDAVLPLKINKLLI